MSDMRGSQKRSRSALQESSDEENVRFAIIALLERLSSIRFSAQNSRNVHAKAISKIDVRIASKQTALRAAARVVPPPPSGDIEALSKGVVATAAVQQPDVSKPPMPAMKLLMQTDPPEKLIHEQSIIVRAQAINRKNAELARERLPKQPEAQRNKTHWDYLMDEAVWLAADFREERKWKIHMARRLARSAIAYHVQKEQRELRAIKEESFRIRRLACTVARDVRKFWTQIRQIAELRMKEVEEIRLKEKRSERLHSMLQEAEKITSTFAETLRAARRPASLLKGNAAVNQKNALATGTVDVEEPKSSQIGKDEDLLSPGPVVSPKDKAPEDFDYDFSAEEGDTREADKFSYTGSTDEAPSADEDDETTMAAAEAEDESDPKETSKLEADAALSVESLLRAQGIDPSLYLSNSQNTAASLDQSNHNSDRFPENHRTHGNELPNRDESLQLRRLNGLNGTLEHIEKSSQSINPGGNTVDLECTAHISRCVKREISRLPGNPEPDLISGGKGGSGMDVDSARVTNHISSQETLSKSAEENPHVIVPSQLLKGTLRDYQLAGFQWLVTLYKSKLNGILADEMGLGKTIQTIALLAWLAAEKGIWGPHLVVVPTSVMVNWEVEFKKWLPGFKILTYYGSLKERKAKRVGWTRPNSFHVCITSYPLVVQDSSALRRKEWVYLILDEAHNIKNFQSLRWQTLLRFPSARRLLLTGTPLQNSVMELWSLLHFLMPHMFQSQAEFKDWFAKPLGSLGANDESPGAKASVVKLHEILRPFLLRRLKREVEKSLPPKLEHVQKCPLSKRQRQLYEDFLSRSETKNTLERGDFFGVMGVLMQLRKVCNHPDLFEGRPILSPFAMRPLLYNVPALVTKVSSHLLSSRVDLATLGLDLATMELSGWRGCWFSEEICRLSAASSIAQMDRYEREQDILNRGGGVASDPSFEATRRVSLFCKSVMMHHSRLTSMKVRHRALLGEDLLSCVTMTPSSLIASQKSRSWDLGLTANISVVKPIEALVGNASSIFERFVCCIRKVCAPAMTMAFAGDSLFQHKRMSLSRDVAAFSSPLRELFRTAEVRSSVTLPDTRLIQWDCGKLQVLAVLLRKLQQNSSRVLIFSQMSKVLNVLESFLNLHAYRYLRLDGATKSGDRQRIVERFNTDGRIFCMILTTRAGGVGLNLTGADAVVFYDTDYNPAIDAQAQDRVHRIGQKKTVHIFRLVSENTVEENILRRANEKRTLESIVISQAGFDIDSIQNRVALQDLVAAPISVQKSCNGEIVRGLRIPLRLDSSRSEMTQYIVPKSPYAKSIMDTTPGSGNKLKSCNTESNSKPVPILSANGSLYQRPYAEAEDHLRQTSISQEQNIEHEKSLKIMAEDSDAYQAILEQDEGGLECAKELDDNEDDFNESESLNESKPPISSTFISLESALTPVQRFALKFVEHGLEHPQVGDSHTIDEKQPLPDERCDPKKRSFVDANCGNLDIASESEDEDILFYDNEATLDSYRSSLKALTDTDANIKLYLPLRDGGPEELKISSVVNGTAAAGLECAEDAAFFPHAYNRMSRTSHATKRQKEKAAYNLRRREELEAKKMREAKAAEAQRVAAQRLAGKLSGSQEHPGRIVGYKAKESTTGISSSKRNKADAGSGSGSGQQSGVQGTELAFPGSFGLFRKNVKRNQRKVSSRYGKSSLSNGGTNPMLGEGIGNNVGWTIEEEKSLIELMARYTGNMAIVSEALALYLEVAVGSRRRRSLKQCIDRWFNAIIKEHKNGSPAPTSSVVDADVWKRILTLESTSSTKISSCFHTFDVKSIQMAETHKSHVRVSEEAKNRQSSRIEAVFPPSYKVTNERIPIVRGHLPGFKPYECTTHALHKKKNPFLRPLRDDFRSLSNRPSGSQSNVSSARAVRQSTSAASIHGQLARSNSRSQAGQATPQVSGRVQGRVSQEPMKGSTARLGTQITQKRTLGNRLTNTVSGSMINHVSSVQTAISSAVHRGNNSFHVGSALNSMVAGRTVGTRPQSANGNVMELGGQPSAICPTPPARQITAPSTTKLVPNTSGSHRCFTLPTARASPHASNSRDAIVGNAMKKSLSGAGVGNVLDKRKTQPFNAAQTGNVKVANLTAVRPSFGKPQAANALSGQAPQRTHNGSNDNLQEKHRVAMSKTEGVSSFQSSAKVPQKGVKIVRADSAAHPINVNAPEVTGRAVLDSSQKVQVMPKSLTDFRKYQQTVTGTGALLPTDTKSTGTAVVPASVSKPSALKTSDNSTVASTLVATNGDSRLLKAPVAQMVTNESVIQKVSDPCKILLDKHEENKPSSQ